MTRKTRTPATLCTSCETPVAGAMLCTACLGALEQDLGDMTALIHEAQRVFTSDDRPKGSEDDPLVHSRPRRLVPVVRERRGGVFCVLHPGTGRPMLEPERLRASEFGRQPSTRWDADHGLGHEIDATVARQTATAKREGGRSSSKPLPFNDRAAKVAHRAQSTLHRWVRVLHDGREPWPRRDVVATAAWLLARVPRIAVHPQAAQIEHDVRAVVGQLRRAVDRPADRWFMGPCDTDGCVEEHAIVDGLGNTRVERRPTELYAEPGAETVRCPRCEVEYPLEERRAWLLAAAEDQLAHAELIGRAAPALGVDITPAMIRNYADRGRIVAKSTDLQGRPLYRVGDVIAVAQDVLAKRASRGEMTRVRRSA